MAPRNLGKSSSAKILPFPQRPSRVEQHRILRVSPEYEGLCLLYAHHALSRDKLYAVKILGWARLANGKNVALLPWLNGISRCIDLVDPESGQSQGYYDPASERRFSDTPQHHCAALDAMSHYPEPIAGGFVQEFPDLIGSHAALLSEKREFELQPVISWRLQQNGDLDAMVADISKATDFPILPGDACLFTVQKSSAFRYFFQYHIANQIKAGGRVATRALTQLFQS
ncbi:hypothetical protein [Zhongshania sp.]|uniref:hypothetical protein n=1 Tax=Zhongshania sp. TaxID=1971902 RepID=UPI00356B1BAB